MALEPPWVVLPVSPCGVFQLPQRIRLGRTLVSVQFTPQQLLIVLEVKSLSCLFTRFDLVSFKVNLYN